MVPSYLNPRGFNTVEDIISVENLLKIYKPNIILADEPTRNPDNNTTVEIMKIFKALSLQGKTIVMTKQDKDIAAFSERIILFEKGKS